MFSVSAYPVQQDYYDMEDSATLEMNSTDVNHSLNDGAQVSITEIVTYSVIVSADSS